MSHAFAELAKRTEEITPFLAVEVFERAQELERQGHEVVHLEFGEPDFETPEVVREAAVRAIRDGRTKYAHSLGLLPLREAIAEHYQQTYRVAVSPDQVLVTAGTSPAMLLLFTGLLSAGDEVVLSNPHYACYPNFVRYADAVPVYVPTPEADGWSLRAEAVRERLSPRTRAVMVNSPANPTGVVMPADRLAALAELAERHGCLAGVGRDLPRPQLRGARPHGPRVHGPRLRVQRLLQGVRDDRLAPRLPDRAQVVRPHAPAAPPELLHLLERVRAVGRRGGAPRGRG